MHTRVGEVKQIRRFPVKSFAGESLTTSRVEAYGLYGDRSHAFIDEAKEGWSRYVTGRHIPSMLGYQAELKGEGEGAGDEFAELLVTAPDGRKMGWDADLLKELQACTDRTLSMLRYKPDSLELLAVDEASILLITDASLRRLEELWGRKLDERRFRANFLVTLADSSFNERDWIGKRLYIGSAEFEIASHCTRCTMISIDPDTLETDASLLKQVSKQMNMIFGVYASVKKTGQVSTGDGVYISG
jgi:uncharacterized protein YcbX